MSLYEILKAAKIGAASDVFTTLRGQQAPFAKGGAKELKGAPPLSFDANGESLLDWYIKGNTGDVGDKTGNMLNPAIIENGYNIDTDGGIKPLAARTATTSPVDVSAVNSVVLSYSSNPSMSFIYALFSGETLVKRQSANTSGAVIDVSDGDAIYFCWYRSGTATKDDLENLMLNAGSTASPYESYGYKIPVTCGGETNTIYLDEPLGASDSISMTDTGISIPTVDGSNTLSVGTTVQPSSVYIKYKE